MITWVIGRGGLLGSAVERQAGTVYLPGPVPWHDPAQARQILHAHARGLEQAGDPVHLRSNFINGIKSLPVRV